jgi:hypothetical protein
LSRPDSRGVSEKLNQKTTRKMIAQILENSVSSALVCTDAKSGAQAWRPMSKKSFALTAQGAGLKNRALKRAYWQYVQQASAEMGAAVTAAVASGKVVITGASVGKKGDRGSVKWESADRFARHEPAAPKKVCEFTALADKLGITVEALRAKLTA